MRSYNCSHSALLEPIDRAKKLQGMNQLVLMSSCTRAGYLGISFPWYYTYWPKGLHGILEIT